MANPQRPASAPMAIATGILTLTNTHPGTGQATASVDLPVARDPATGMPVLPATSLKGVARAALEDAGLDDSGKKWIKHAFGPELNGEETEKLVAAALNFGEGQLLVYPLRAMHRPQLFATSPLLLRRWNRLRRAHGLSTWKAAESVITNAGLASDAGGQSHAAMAKAPTTVTVVEDVALARDQIKPVPGLTELATALGTLLPDEEAATRAELADGLILLSDPLLGMILRRALPVQARIKLGPNKTTSDGGNLWYEELLPADCLFGAVISARTESDQDTLQALRGHHAHWRSVQIGGGETVGLGRCLWTIEGGK